MKLLKWLSVTDRFYKIYLDKQLAPYGINNSQYMFLIKICRSPGILQDSLLNMVIEMDNAIWHGFMKMRSEWSEISNRLSIGIDLRHCKAMI